MLGKAICVATSASSFVSRRLAIKTEKYTRSVLSNDANVLKLATQYKCSRIVEFIDYGVVKPRYCFLVMPLLGRNLSTLRSQQRDQHFTLQTAVRVSSFV